MAAGLGTLAGTHAPAHRNTCFRSATRLGRAPSEHPSARQALLDGWARRGRVHVDESTCTIRTFSPLLAPSHEFPADIVAAKTGDFQPLLNRGDRI